MIHYSSKDKELINSKYWEQIQECEKELKKFLANFEYPNSYDKIYISLLSYVKDAPPEYKRVNYFFMRSVDPFIMFNDDACFFSLRLPSFWFFGNITGLDDKELNSIGLNPNGGSFNVAEDFRLREPNISSFTGIRLQAYNNMFDSISQNQTDKVINDILKNIEQFRACLNFRLGKNCEFDKMRISQDI